MYAYIYNAALLCEDCAEHAMTDLGPCNGRDDSDQYPQGPYSDGGGEADRPHHCDACQAFLENSLTDEGLTYVSICMAEAERAGRGNDSVALTVWGPFYDIDPPFTRIRLVQAIAVTCAEYHSGQASRGYRLLCRCSSWLKKHHTAWDENYFTNAQEDMVSTLSDRYGARL